MGDKILYTKRMGRLGVQYNPEVHTLEKDIIKITENKLPIHEVPTELIMGAAEAKLYGTKKYNDKDNWQKVELENWIGGLFRHIYAYRDGEMFDKESGLHHLSHAAINLAYIMYNENKGK